MPQLVFGSAEEFLHEQLLPTYVRDVDDPSAKWCMEWFFHPEAMSRVEALWRAWEHLRLDGATGISVWWRDHADHHMRVLMDPRGRSTTQNWVGPVRRSGTASYAQLFRSSLESGTGDCLWSC